MTVVSPCGFREEAWPFDCDIADYNGMRWDPDTGDVWTPPDDGTRHFDEAPTVRAAYITSLGAEYDVDSASVGTEFSITHTAQLEWENTTCHRYWVLTEFIMGQVVTALGASTTAYAGSHNTLDLDGTSLVDSTPYIGSGYNATAVPAFGLATQFFPPVIWSVWTSVAAGETLTATLQGMGLVTADGSGGAETVQVRYGWNLVMTCYPKGVG